MSNTQSYLGIKNGVVLCVDGYPLGFVKQDRSRLKNMYLPGWRMQ